ncbi:MAG TPA: NTF2 fold immunity protein [Alphaproteobacteria bacterium]|jgi:hypothetical protein|nr:NTF2 fold immunity protein [Alphaproteobacteria bacterium]
MSDIDSNGREPAYSAKDRAEIFRMVQRAMYGDSVKDTDSAVALAEVLVARNFGKSVLEKQQPLTAREDGDAWIIEGSAAKIQPKPGMGPVIVRLAKADAKVESLYLSAAGPKGPFPFKTSKDK